MWKRVGIVLVVFVLGASYGRIMPFETTQPQEVRNACLALVRSLGVLTAAADRHWLTAEQKLTVDRVMMVVDPICSSPMPPANGLSAVESAREVLEGILLAAEGTGGLRS